VTGSRSAQSGEPTCGKLVTGGVASYPCSLPAGHQLPAEDPEPCRAVEVPASVRAHAAWRAHQDQPRGTSAEPQCPQCGVSTFHAEGTSVVCPEGHEIGKLLSGPVVIPPPAASFPDGVSSAEDVLAALTRVREILLVLSRRDVMVDHVEEVLRETPGLEVLEASDLRLASERAVDAVLSRVPKRQ
jgi:hypothetical protein